MRSWQRLLMLVYVVCVTSNVLSQSSGPQASGPQAFGVQVSSLQGMKTVAEESAFEATSTEAEVQQFLKRLAAAAPATKLDSIGNTNEGRPLHALVIGKPLAGQRQVELPLPADDPRLTVVIIGNIHSGECDGKEALLAMMRDILIDMPKSWDEKLVLAIVPNFNADGNERVGLAHRPGQIGPTRGMGLRENAQNLDLNRDFIKLQSPEVRGLVRAIDLWRADVLIDCHTTNGSLHRYPLTYDVPHNPACHGKLLSWLRDQYLPEITSRLSKNGLETFYYGNFDAEHKKWETFGHEPRYSTEYMGCVEGSGSSPSPIPTPRIRNESMQRINSFELAWTCLQNARNKPKLLSPKRISGSWEKIPNPRFR